MWRAGSLTDEQKQWFVDYFKKLCRVGLVKGPDKVRHALQVTAGTCLFLAEEGTLLSHKVMIACSICLSC